MDVAGIIHVTGFMHVADLARFLANYVDKPLSTTHFNPCYQYSPGPVSNQHSLRRNPSRSVYLLRGRTPDERCVAYAGARLSKMAMHRTWVTTPLEPADFLFGENTSEEEFGVLA